MSESHSYRDRFAFAVAAALAVGCGPVEQDPGVVATKVSRSSTIALSEDGARVAMVNPEDHSLSVFQTSDHARTAKLATGTNPASVVIAGDSKTAFVANRADATVVRIRGLDTGTPAIDATAAVGSEPVGLALSPTGRRLFVAEFAESRVSVIDTQTMAVIDSFSIDRPRALLVTNNGDALDDDEQLAVTQFYGVPVPGREAKDDGRTGVVRIAPLANLADAREISLASLDSGFPKGGVAGNATVITSPNQLAALATANGKLYITSVSASPEGPTRFDNNVYPVVHVADLATATELRDATGTVNLARAIYDAIPAPSAQNPRFIPGELSDLDFVAGSNIAYAIGRAGDVMQRVTFGDRVEIGSTQNTQIDLAGNDAIGKCQNPTGVVVDGERNIAYVNCWITRRLGVVDLSAQALVATFEAAAAPANAAEASIQRGKRFYFTGRGRWSAAQQNGAKGGEGWSSCGSCHPDGLSDNITWVFASGPRQTTSQDGSFSHGAGAQKQRIFNWTGIFDEHHDFERNTRDVSGGLGAITTAPTLADCNQLDRETPVALVENTAAIGGLQKPLKELADDAGRAVCGHKDWDDIDNFVKTITPAQAVRTVAADAVERGRQLFVDGGCAKCHGGAGWTVSRRAFAPSEGTNALLAQTAFERPDFFPLTWMYDNGTQPRTQLSAQPAIAIADATGPAEPSAIGIAQAACVTRNVGTFGLPDDTAGTDALELRPFQGSLVRAQGRAGYNVPSLYGLALGAPYLHHGQAGTLEELFVDERWRFHTAAGNANFSAVLAQPGTLDDLVAFLRSIDATTPEIAVPTDPGTGLSFDACP
jgi:DNA-binding beta-propeller fold protein YncE/cytochrome c553